MLVKSSRRPLNFLLSQREVSFICSELSCQCRIIFPYGFLSGKTTSYSADGKDLDSFQDLHVVNLLLLFFGADGHFDDR